MQGYANTSNKKALAIESRAGHLLREYLDTLRGERPFASENEINPHELRSIWDYCFLISIDPVTKYAGYRYSYLGQKLIEAYGDDSQNSDIAIQLISTTSESLTDNFDAVLQTKKPVIDEAEFVNLKHLNVKYRISLFPLGTDMNITHIIGCMRWRIY
jgi:hypothetical protein